MTRWIPIAVLVVGIALILLSSRGLFSSSTPDGVVLTENLTVLFLDVGQGDCILVDYGATEVLIDTGPKDCKSEEKIAPYIQGPIEGVIITHNHADHDGNLDLITNNFKVDKLIKNSDVQTGDSLVFGDLEFRVLNANEGWEDENQNSIVLQLDTKGASFLFTGDATTETESYMMYQGLLTDIDILKVGHHGSKYSSSSDFLSFTKPEVAIISVGLRNPYKHPSLDALLRLKSVHADTYRTDKHGTISVTVSESGYNVQHDY